MSDISRCIAANGSKSKFTNGSKSISLSLSLIHWFHPVVASHYDAGPISEI